MLLPVRGGRISPCPPSTDPGRGFDVYGGRFWVSGEGDDLQDDGDKDDDVDGGQGVD